MRAAIVLRRGEGITQQQVAEQFGVSKTCVNKWSQRFEREGLEGLEDRKGRRPASIPAHKVEQVITRATQPPHPRQRWSVRTMAKAVHRHRIWPRHAPPGGDLRFPATLSGTSIRLREAGALL